MSTMGEDLTKSGHLNVRWQAQMEEHLKRVRELDKVVGHGRADNRTGEMATANAIAAVALAIANTVGDLELPLSKIADAAERMGD